MARKLSGIRRGITLIELLVVMMIMLILATIVVAFAPGFQDAQKVGRGADQLQGWLLTARQWAKKDRLPTGIRLSVSTDPKTGNTVATDLQYIQQPSTYIVPYGVPAQAPGIQPVQPIARKITITGSSATFDPAWTASLSVPGQIPGDFAGGGTNPILPGDYLVLHEAIYSITTLSSTQLTLGSGLPANITVPPTTDYYFVRAPRPLSGESTLKLPQDVAIDLGQPTVVPPIVYSVNMTASASGYDVLFSPSGELLAPVSSNKIILWVRDLTRPQAQPPTPRILGTDSLIAIDTRTGLIASQPVNPNSSNYYLYTQDARSSGL